MIAVRILIEGEKVQEIGYLIFLLEKALENNIERICVRNVDNDKVEVLLNDEEDRISSFHESIKNQKPEAAIVRGTKRERYDGKMPVPIIERYFRFLTLEQLRRDGEEVRRLLGSVSKTIETATYALKGIYEKLGKTDEKLANIGEKSDSATQRYDVFGDTPRELTRSLLEYMRSWTG